ncbi:MAG TPA: DedA family protein [Gemmatimonadaceae bacterium]|nr:DedA family protein [Gemmatimonadaceae bacterium]
MLDTIINWLGNLPIGTLYVAIAGLSAFENFFPPFPSDGVIAFGSFLASRAEGSPLIVFLLGWFGNVAGAMVTYTLARRFGSDMILKRLEKYVGPTAENRMMDLIDRYGFGGLFVSRFLPGVRAIVPPFAGAMRLPSWKVFLAIASASAVWFGIITFLAFRAGDNWELLQYYLMRSGQWAGVISGTLVALIVGIWLLRRRKRQMLE